MLKLANDHFSFRGSDNAATTLAQAALDPKAFARLTDAILDSIYVSLEEGLDEAQGLIERMKKRDYYRQIGRSTQISPLPQCYYCGELTEIRSKFCGACGKKCKGRLHVSERPDEPHGPNNPAVPPAARREACPHRRRPHARPRVQVAQLIGKRPPDFEQDILTFVDEAWRAEAGEAVPRAASLHGLAAGRRGAARWAPVPTSTGARRARSRRRARRAVSGALAVGASGSSTSSRPPAQSALSSAATTGTTSTGACTTRSGAQQLSL